MTCASVVFCVCLASFASVTAQEAKRNDSVLITNARVFDGQSEKLADGMSVLVEGNKISRIAASIPAPAGAAVIDAKGRVLMPGLFDAHWHIVYSFWPLSKVVNAESGTLTLAAAKAPKETLLRGFTTVRDAGGADIPIAKAVDSGLIEGSRVYPAGAPIVQSSGHGDFRRQHNIPEEKNEALDYLQKTGHTLIADCSRGNIDKNTVK